MHYHPLHGRDERALLKDRRIGIILANGGRGDGPGGLFFRQPGLVSALATARPLLKKSANIPLAVKRIFDSKTFDNGTICASEQSVVVERCSKDAVMAELTRQGGYFMNVEESEKVSKFILRANGTMNPAIVGKSAARIADMAGISIPAGTRVLISEQTTVSKKNPYSREKLCPILAFYVEDDWHAACERCIESSTTKAVGPYDDDPQ